MWNVIGVKIVATLRYLGLRLALLLSFTPLLFLFSATCTLVLAQSVFLQLEWEMRHKSPKITALGVLSSTSPIIEL